MALINHQMPVVRNDIVDLTLARQTLDHADIHDAAGVASAAADLPDRGCGKIEKCPEPRNPLFHELAAVNEHQRVGPAGGDDGGGDDRLAKPGRGRKHPGLVPQHRGGGLLFRGQGT